jgi:HSP20 family protein
MMATVVKYHPWSMLGEIQSELTEMFNRGSSRQDAADVVTGQWSPKVDIREEKEKYRITADLPGVDPQCIEVSLENQVLSIKGERCLDGQSQEEGCIRMERQSGTFYRKFSLPQSVDVERIEAVGKHGVLTITVPKKAVQNPKRIEVRTQGS